MAYKQLVKVLQTQQLQGTLKLPLKSEPQKSTRILRLEDCYNSKVLDKFLHLMDTPDT